MYVALLCVVLYRTKRVLHVDVMITHVCIAISQITHDLLISVTYM